MWSAVWSLLAAAIALGLAPLSLSARWEWLTFWLFCIAALFLLATGIVAVLAIRRSRISSSESQLSLSVGTSGQFSRRVPSSNGGATHILYAELHNSSRDLITGGALSVTNISPAIEDTLACCLERNLVIPSGVRKYIALVTRNEKEPSNKNMLLQCERMNGFLIPAGHGLLNGSHYFDLKFVCDQNVNVSLSCRIFIDGDDMMCLKAS